MRTRFFLTHAPTPEIYTLSLHDALPISKGCPGDGRRPAGPQGGSGLAVRRDGGGPGVADYRFRREAGRSQDPARRPKPVPGDRKSTRLNSSHVSISYAVFCLKKKTKYHT